MKVLFITLSFLLGLIVGSAAMKYIQKKDSQFLKAKAETARSSYTQGCKAGVYFTIGTLTGNKKAANLCSQADVNKHVEQYKK